MSTLYQKNSASAGIDLPAEYLNDATSNCRTVTLEEFTTLMMGALSGRDPKETLWAVFTVLSRPSGGEGGEKDDGLITVDKLKAVCTELKVTVIRIVAPCAAAAAAADLPPPPSCSSCCCCFCFFLFLLLLFPVLLAEQRGQLDYGCQCS